MKIKKFFLNSKNINDYFCKKYIFGFVLSVLVYFFTFFILSGNYLSMKTRKNYIFFFLILQISLQFKYFLNFKLSYKNYWNIIFLIFTLLIISIIFIGSLWIMGNLNH